MKHADSTAPRDPRQHELLTACLALLDLAETGKLDDLPCPQCKEASVSVWTARPSQDEYRTWFSCQKCNFHTRVHNTGRPSYYSEDRDPCKKEEVTT